MIGHGWLPSNEPGWRIKAVRALFALGLCLFTGCQSLDFTPLPTLKEEAKTETTVTTPPATPAATSPPVATPPPEPATTPATPPSTQAVDADLLNSFRVWLDRDEWQIDVRWSVLAEEVCPSRPWRWLFVAGTSSQQGAGKTGTETSDPARWQWVWDGRLGAPSETDTQAALLVLETLSKEAPSRQGIHATVLLARLKPSPTWSATLGRWTSTGTAAEADPPPLATSFRCAAAEAWVACLLAEAAPDEQHLIEPGRLLERPGLSDELLGTLWRSLATAIVPDRLPQLSATLSARAERTATEGLRIAALEACVIAAAGQRAKKTDSNEEDAAASNSVRGDYSEDDWPIGLTACRLDPSPRLRLLTGRWVAWCRHPEAVNLLTSQLRDTDPAVQDAALVSLGLLQTPAARDRLHQWASGKGDRQTAMAVAALAHFGSQELERYAASPAVAVRAAVAKGLRFDSSPAGRRLLRRLLADPQAEVQTAAVQSISTFPVPEAVPLLLAAIEGGLLATRQDAQFAMNRLLTEPPVLPIDGTSIERRDAVRLWAATHGYPLEEWPTETLVRNSSEESDVRQTEISNLLEALITTTSAADLHQEWLDPLFRLCREEDVPRIEKHLQGRNGSGVRSIEEQLLPRISPAYSTLRELQSPDIRVRREAARRLQQMSSQRPLSIAMVGQLRQRLSTEQDTLVWRSCLAAVQEDGHEAAVQVSLLALHQPWPDLRRMGAAYFQQHPSPEAVTALLPLLQDPQVTVQIAAIQALAATGNPVAIDGLPPSAEGTGLPGLRPLVSSPREELRWAALAALVRLRDEAAVAELGRQLQSTVASDRQRAVEIMGQSGQPRFIEPLIRLAWTEASGPVRLAILHSLEILVPPDERPDPALGLVAAPSIDDNVRCWVQWWDARQSTERASLRRAEGAEGSP